MGKPTYLALHGRRSYRLRLRLTTFVHVNTHTHTHFLELVMGESTIWHAQARARRGAGLRLPG